MSGSTLAALAQPIELEGALRARGLGAASQAKAALFAQGAGGLLAAGLEPQTRARAFFVPGRVEVLGKHTDYAGGRSLVTAVEQGFCLVAVPRDDAQVTVHAVALQEQVRFALDPELVAAHGHWSNYPMTVARRLARNFPSCRRGVDLAFASDLPPASGMSSSSALIVATFLVLAAVNDLSSQELYRRNVADLLALAGYLGTIENGQSFGELAGDQGVGTFGGSEDHTAILCSQVGALGQFAYCPARFERRIPVPRDQVFAVGFSGVVAEKTGAAQELYNRASARVRALVELWQQATGRQEMYLADILASRPDAAEELRQILARQGAGRAAELGLRLEHFIAENEQIVGPAGEALARGDLAGFGRLVDRSQELTESLLGNQVPQTVALAHLARQGGAAAASAFGAGFGGSVWAMVTGEQAQDFLRQWGQEYARVFPAAAARARFFLTQAGPAAFELERA